MKAFTNLYSLSKTIRFELKPIGKTLEFINKNGLLVQDEHRADSYIKVKKIIDEYHKAFIENALRDFKLRYEDIEAYYSYYIIKKKEENQKKAFENIQASLRKQIASCFKQNKSVRLFEKELIKEDLINFVKTNEERLLVEEFKDFTTYFKGFHENRKNMYSEENKSTSIAYRLINENLPKFIDNITIFERVKNTSIENDFKTIYSDLEGYLNVVSIEDIFNLNYFTEVLTQTQIEVYNAIIGGKSFDDGRKIKGLNEYINLYNQTQKDKTKRLPKLKVLFKQILSDRNAISYIPEEFKNDNEVLLSIEKVYQDLNQEVFNKKNQGEYSLKELLLHIKDFELDKIYLRNDLSLTDISQKHLGNWGIINQAIANQYIKDNPKTAKESQEKYEEKIKKYLNSFDSFSIQFINDCLEDKTKKVEEYFIQCKNKDDKNLFLQIEIYYNAIKDLLNIDYPENKQLSQDKESVEKIKLFLDSIKELQWFIKPFLEKGEVAEKDEKFYGEFSSMWKLLDDSITPLYNKVRNYMTKKPYSEEKIKLNFENSTLLDGWDVNKESDNTSVIFRKDGLYYLGIMNKKHNRIFDNKNIKTNGVCYEKMDYKFFKDLTTMVPKCTTQLKAVKAHFLNNDSDYILDGIQFIKPLVITKEIFNLNNQTFEGKKKFQIDYLRLTNDELGYKKGLLTWMNFCIDFLNAYKSTTIYDLTYIKPESYQRIDDFYKDINLLLFKITFRNVSEEYINTLVEEGKLYLFQIYNKDFSSYSKGTPNMHTLYWKMLFDEENLKNVVYKLNGQAEVFFRKSSIKEENRIIHKANNPIQNKNEQNHKKVSLFDYDITKDRRYTIDKFQFHVPITINFKAIGSENINPNVNQYIKENKVKHIIGIDRGERHLLYLSLIDLKGNIIKQFSLNEIINEYKGETYKTNYHDLLNKKEVDRDEARKNWQTIENIKELKEGYLSQVIHKITQLMVEYNAIVVLEDLNFGFMRGRQKVEKQVYQKFEKMLIDKLNYLVDKKKTPQEEGGLLNAYQLTSKFESFQKLGKQSGFLFYVPAWNTSKIDPTTGFVNLFDTRYENIEKAKAFFDKFNRIEYNKTKDYFEFEFDYNKFTTKAEGTKTTWTLCTNSTRIETFRNKEKNSQWDSKEIVLSQAFKDLFNKYDINYTTNLKVSITSQVKKEFFEELLHLLKLTLQMRNSKTGTEIDYLISPVANKKGEFYDSRIVNDTLPKDADANGAFNIARKGLWVIDQIKQTEDLKKLKLAISNKEWLSYVQSLVEK